METLTISDVRIGVLLSAVLLSDGSCGVSSTVTDILTHCDKKSRDYGDFSPLKIIGQKVFSLFETDKKSSLIDTLKTAVLNAISSKLISTANYRIIENSDPIDLIDLSSKKTITVVGGFQTYIQKISETNNKLYVLELNEKALSEEQKQFYIPADQYANILPSSDIVFITGLTLVNNTIDDLLASISPKAKVIVTGPSSSIIPDILFENKVSIIGATRITDSDLLFSIVGEAGAGFHLFKYCAQKISILND
ncbi:MAG: DUF364 domain-containing protein [Bacteroidia bacterium]|nr:DUF364 domain-containing protein [Bacteroidia bacterium]